MQCGTAYDVMRRECHHYHMSLYSKGSVLAFSLKQHGVEVEPWFDGSASSSSAGVRSVTPVINTSQSSSSNNSGGAAVAAGLVRLVQLKA